MATVYINMTQHTATRGQVAAGVIDLDSEAKAELARLLTVEEVPDLKDLRERALGIASIVAGSVEGARAAGDTVSFMLGGAPFLMPVLARVLSEVHSASCVYAFSRRVSVEDTTTGVKTSVFAHVGFVPHYD